MFKKKILFILSFSILFLFLLIFFLSLLVIRNSVFTRCNENQNLTTGTCQKDLEILLMDENQSFRKRNQAIWVLGQLADKKSLPVLEKYYTGNIPKKESLDKSLSQYELQKALKWCRQGNITSWMYGDEELL